MSRRRKPVKRAEKCMPFEYNISHLWEEIRRAEGIKSSNILFAAKNVFVCRPCQVTKNVTQIMDHVSSLEHHESMNMEINMNRNLKVIHEEEHLWTKLHPALKTHQIYIRIQDEKRMFCYLCDKIVPATIAYNLQCHIEGKKHMNKVIWYLQSVYSVLQGLQLHPDILKIQHHSESIKKDVKVINEITEPTNDEQLRKFYSLLNEINAYDINFACLLCEIQFDSGELWLNHMTEIFHKENVRNLSKCDKTISKYICYACNTIMCGEKPEHHCIYTDDGFLVPRIFVSGYSREVNLESLYNIFTHFGTVTNCAVTVDEAVFEFEEREAVSNILKNSVTYKESVLNIEPLQFKESQELQELVEVDKHFQKIFSSYDSFDSQIRQLCKNIESASIQEDEERLGRFLEKELSKAFETKVTIYFFGSRVSGIALPESDVDVFADTDNMYDGEYGLNAPTQDHIVNVVNDALETHPDCEHVIAVPKARTPIVKFRYKPTGRYCDIAFRHGLGCENTKLIRFYISLDPRIKPLMGFLKYWMKVHDLSGQRKFTSYALMWLIIFFLQQLPDFNFPSVEQLEQLYTGKRKTIAGWDCTFCDDAAAITLYRIPHSVLQLVHEFFKFYSKFDFSTYIVCPLTGGPEPKSLFIKNLQGLPVSLRNYINKITLDKYAEKLYVNSACCIQDPFELNHNLCKSTSYSTINRFQYLCSLGQQLCTKLEY